MGTELKWRSDDKIKAATIEQLDWETYHLVPVGGSILRDVFLDTADQMLTSQGHVLRLHDDGSVVNVSLHSPPSGRNARKRSSEWHADTTTDSLLDPTRWPVAIRTRLQKLVGEEPLTALVEVHTQHRTWEVWQELRFVAELALNVGRISVGTDSETFREVHLARRGEGTTEDVRVLIQRLKQGIPLIDEHRSILDRGLALLRHGLDTAAPPTGQRNIDVPMLPQSPLGEAGRTVLRKHWNRLRKHEAGACEARPDDVHDMRVATRRLRAMLSVLDRTIYDPTVTRRLRKGLKRLASALGDLRDSEVMVLAAETYRNGLEPPDRPGLEPLIEALQERLHIAHGTLRAELSRKRTRRLLQHVKDFVQTAEAGVPHIRRRPSGMPIQVCDVAGSALWQQLEAVQAFGDSMPEAPLPVFHDLRIACKHLRYTVELFQSALAAEAKALLADLGTVQDQLGALQDAAVLLPVLDGLVDQLPENIALQHYRRHLEVERDRRWHDASQAWTTVGGVELRQRIAQLLVEL
ncbi:MAG: hypothetical protein NVS2B7_29130 [Herpetosiphon sp.]